MSYCTVSDIQSLFPNYTFSAISIVTTTAITNTHIPITDALIDARLRKYYTVPITDDTDLVLMKSISMYITAGKVARLLYETTTQPNENAPAWAKFDIGEKTLADIVAGEVDLVTGRADSIFSRVEEIYEEQDQVEKDPIVTLDREF